jgi:hypothetical protein
MVTTIPNQLPYKRQKIEKQVTVPEKKVITKSHRKINFGAARTTKVDKLVLGVDV